MRVRNTGPLMDEFSFSPVGMAQGWISVEPSIVSLFPGAEEQVQVHFRPPRLHTTLAGASPFAVKVVPREDPESTSVVEGTLHVTPFEERGVDLVPTTSRGRRVGVHDLLVRNTGNAALPAPARRRRPEGPAPLRLQPVDAAGRAGHGPAQPGPGPAPAVASGRGEPRTWPFQLVLDEEGKDDPQIVGGAMLQEPLAPSWLGRAIVGTSPSACWRSSCSGSSCSSRRSRTPPATPCATSWRPSRRRSSASGITLPPTTVKGGTVPPPAPTTTTISPLGDPVEFRLSLSTPAVRRARGQTLFVTDLVLQNPDSNTGRITVAIDGQPVFDSALDFFRDLDRHFVSPLDGRRPARTSPRRWCAPGRRAASARPPPPSAPSCERTDRVGVAASARFGLLLLASLEQRCSLDRRRTAARRVRR